MLLQEQMHSFRAGRQNFVKDACSKDAYFLFCLGFRVLGELLGSCESSRARIYNKCGHYR